ncbi:MAG: polysaccharide biosynthesis C-terminal domain-containing protein, partial [bacterium]
SPLGLGANGLVIAHVAASLVAATAAAFVVVRKYRFLGWPRTTLDPEIKKETIKYTSPMAAMDSLNLLVARVDIMLIGHFLNATSAGYYGIAVEIISVIKRVRQGFEPIFSPMVSDLFYREKKGDLQRNYLIVTRWLMAGSLLPTLAIALFATQILSMFSNKAVEAGAALIILAISHGIFGSFSAAESLLIMTGRSFLNTVLAAGMLLINCLVSIPLIPKMGLAGAALGILAAFLFATGARIYQVYKHYQLHPFGSTLFWPMITGSVTLMLFYTLSMLVTVNSLVEIILVFLGLLLFYVAFYFFGATEPEERYLIGRLKNKISREPAIENT